MTTVMVKGSRFISHYPVEIPKGTVNGEAVSVRLDEEWDGLSVFWHWKNLGTGAEKREELADPSAENAIPWEVLEDLGDLQMGLVGMDGEDVVKPTIWLNFGKVVEGVDPDSGLPPKPPTPNYLQQMVEQATQANQAAQAAQNASEEAAKSAASAGPYAQAAKDAAEAAKESQKAASTSAQEAGDARDQANTASNAAKVHADAAGTAKVAAERAAEMAGNAQSGAVQSAKSAADSAKEAETAKQEAKKAASILPAPSLEDAGKFPMVNPEGNGYIFGEAGGGKIDDSTLGRGTTWSSLKIVDSLAPKFESSGPVVTCNPVPGYPISVVSAVKALQGGTGDPSPENVRPISGWDSVSVRIAGVNLWDNNADSSIVEEYPSGNGYLAYPIKLKPNADYMLYIPTNNRGTQYISLTTENVQANHPKATIYINLVNTETYVQGHKKFRTSTNGYVFINVTSKTADQFWSRLRETVPQLMIYAGTEEIPYEPFVGKNVTSQFGQTVYGGKLNWTTGELTVTHICADIKSTDAWGDSTAVNGYVLNKVFGIAEGGAALCNIAPVSHSGGAGSLTASVAYGYVRMSDFKTIFPTLDEWRGFLDKIGGVQIVGRLKTPTTVKLTPTEILALPGTDTIYTDTGDITVSGRADPNATIKGLLSRIDALEKAAIGGV